jgi:hypothetical protein
MKSRFSVRNAVAAHLGEDAADLERTRRYQPTRTPCPVYSVGNDYLTATAGRKPRESNDAHLGLWRWKEIKANGYAKAMGWRIWKAVT